MLNIDRHIAILAGWIAGPAVGVALMAAPFYLQLQPGVLAALLFWGGIAVFLFTVGVVVTLSLHEQGKRKAVLGPILVMALGAIIFCGGAAWYFWSPRLQPSFATPDIVLLAPVYDFKLVWRAPTNNEIIMLPERGADNSPLKTGVPVFRIKNIGTDVARSVHIEWDIDPNLFKTSIQKSVRLRKYRIEINNRNLGIFEGSLDDKFIENAMNTTGLRGKFVKIGVGSGYVGAYATRAAVDIPYLAPEINNDKYQEIEMPFAFTELLEFILISSLPIEMSMNKTVIPISVAINWISGDVARSAYYKVDAEAFNISDTTPAGTAMPPSPEALALVSFKVFQRDTRGSP